jgi:hypothetical protein
MVQVGNGGARAAPTPSVKGRLTLSCKPPITSNVLAVRGFMSLFGKQKEQEPEPVEVFESPLKYVICGHGRFWRVAAQLSTGMGTALGAAWAELGTASPKLVPGCFVPP